MWSEEVAMHFYRTINGGTVVLGCHEGGGSRGEAWVAGGVWSFLVAGSCGRWGREAEGSTEAVYTGLDKHRPV